MSRHSLSRTGNNAYSGSYLISNAWRARRRRWFEGCRQAGFEPACQGCGITLTQLGTLDLHHVSYARVHYDAQRERWRAGEVDEDLVPMCRECHSWLHQIMDRSKDFYGWDRETATFTIIGYLHQALAEDPLWHQHLLGRAPATQG